MGFELGGGVAEALLVMGSDENNARAWPLVLDLFGRAKSIELFHFNIHEDPIGLVFCEGAQCLSTIAALELLIRIREQFPDTSPHGGGIIDYQHFHGADPAMRDSHERSHKAGGSRPARRDSDGTLESLAIQDAC